MKKISIQDLVPGLVGNIEVQLPATEAGYKESYFEWTASSLMMSMNTTEVTGGILKAWHHTPVFFEVETHVDAEMFYFISGVALMLFVDMDNGKPVLDTAQIVRIKPGTQIIIPAGKGHFVAVAESSEPVNAVVVTPKMDAPRVSLTEPLEGI